MGTSPTLHLTNMDINFLSTSNISPNAGAFNDYDVLQIDNCSISYANTMHNTDSIFFNCSKVKLKNSRISVTLPANAMITAILVGGYLEIVLPKLLTQI